MQLCSICFLKDLDADFGVNSKNETQKINSIDWLIYDSSQRAEAMKQANAIIRGFLGTCVMLCIFIFKSADTHWKQLIIFAKGSIWDVCYGSECALAFCLTSLATFYHNVRLASFIFTTYIEDSEFACSVGDPEKITLISNMLRT